MPDARISELPLATPLGDTDLAPLVQATGAGTETRRATVAQLRNAVLSDRGAHVRDYGAKGDGVTDDASAIQAAIDDLKTKGGGTLQFGARTYRIASPIRIEGATVRLQGVGFTEAPGAAQGTWLQIDGTGFTPLTFTGGMARGGGLRDIAVRQSHAAPGAGWAPTPHDWVVRVEDCFGGVDIDNLFLCGVDRGILCRNSGRLDIRRLRGQVFTCGVEIDECFDVPRLHNLHFWPFWSDSTDVVRWCQANGDAMVLRRSDGVFIDQAFVLGYRSMFRFAGSAAGVTTKFYIGQAYVDFCKYGVWIEADGVDGQIANLTTHGEIFASGGQPIAGSHGLRLGGANARVQIGNLRVDSVEDNPLRIEGSGNRLDIFALRCVRYNTRGNGAAAIHLAESGAGAPNAVYLGAPPLLEGGSTGPVVNTGTNGALAMGAPAGRAARPGLMLGGTDTGLFAPATTALAVAAGGAEVLRATAAGTLTLGGAPGGHALEVATPLSTANRVLVSGSAAGGAVAVQAQGADASIDLALSAKGTGLVRGVTPAAADNSTALATTAWVRGLGYAPLAGPVFTAPALAGNGSGGNLARLAGAGAGTPVAVGADASSADANVGLALTPKGNGPLTAQVPDSTAAGGNARGSNAVDFQTSRGAAGRVASGTRAFLGAGTDNTASGQDSAVLGGNFNTASQFGAAVVGGNANTADGTFSWVPGGARGTVRGAYGKGAWGSGRFAADGDAQAGEQVLRRQGTDATAIRLTADGGAQGPTNIVNLPNNSSFLVRYLVVARQVGGTAGTAGDSAAWEGSMLMRRGATAAAMSRPGGGGAGLVPTHSDAGAAAWRLDAVGDTTHGGFAFNGIGEANKTINWVARVLSVEAVG